MNRTTLKPKSIDKSYSYFDFNPVMQVLGKQDYLSMMGADDKKRQEWELVRDAMRHEIEEKGTLPLSDAMMAAYSLGVIHGKQMEREKKKKG